MTLQGADPFTWRRVMRRARLGSSVKLVACILADYANPDGTSVRPGNLRLTATTELGDKTVRRALEKLRELGLIERVFEGSKMGRRGLADEYRLTIPDDLMGRVRMLGPDEQEIEDAATLPTGPVDNPGTPVTVTCEQPATPVTVTGDPAQPEPGTPVTGSRTPVTGSRNTGHRDRPPNQAPNHSPTNKNSGCSDHGAGLEGTGPRWIDGNDQNDLHSDDDATRYAAASRILGRLPDLGAEFMTMARTEMPGAGLRELVVHAAELVAKGIPA
jgi:DNA-binding transcriptional ArsR family regulator